MSAATKEEVVVMENLGNTADFNVAFSPNKKNSRRLKRQATRIYKRRFRSILTEQFGDEESWWLAAEAVLKEEGFAVKVCCVLIFARAVPSRDQLGTDDRGCSEHFTHARQSRHAVHR